MDNKLWLYMLIKTRHRDFLSYIPIYAGRRTGVYVEICVYTSKWPSSHMHLCTRSMFIYLHVSKVSYAALNVRQYIFMCTCLEMKVLQILPCEILARKTCIVGAWNAFKWRYVGNWQLRSPCSTKKRNQPEEVRRTELVYRMT